MADPKKPPPAPPAKVTEAADSSTTSTTSSGVAGEAGELAKLRAENAELKGRQRKISVAIRKLAAAILTPVEEGDRGAGRTNVIAQSLTTLVKEFGFEIEE